MKTQADFLSAPKIEVKYRSGTTAAVPDGNQINDVDILSHGVLQNPRCEV